MRDFSNDEMISDADWDNRLQTYYQLENVTAEVTKSVVCVGSFDGVHKGHRMLFKEMQQCADRIGGQSVVVTFDPHPRLVLKGENRLLSTHLEKIFLMQEAGVRNLYTINFTKDFSELSYTDFVKKYIIDGLKAQVVFVGDGHGFGKDRQGGIDVLESFGLEVHRYDRLEDISSTAIRDAIKSGDMARATDMLGDRYLITDPCEDATKLMPNEIDRKFVRQIKYTRC